MIARCLQVGTVAGLAVALTGAALAGGPARSNALSARATGMGGAVSAVVDDPSALHFNPAGLAFGASGSLLFSVEVVSVDREYTPRFADATCSGDAPSELCEPQALENGILPLPTIGYAYRPTIDGTPSRLTVGIGAWAYFGGVADFAPFDNQQLPAYEETTSFAIEIAPGFSYEVNDKLAIGAALRIGIGVVSLVSTNKPIDANLDGVGLGVGGNLGIMLKPTDRLSIGAVYRTAMTNSIDGEGDFDFGNGPRTVSFDLQQQWPQSAGFGVAVHATERLLLSGQVDWIDWSRLNTIRFAFPAVDLPDQVILLDWNDNLILRAGAELRLGERATARLGGGYDSRVIPDRTTDRALSDGHAVFGTAGVSVGIADGWTLDGSIEVNQTMTVEIEDNSDELGGVILNPPGSISPATAANPAPGDHDARTLALTIGFRFQH